ncbi:uncharacterized protein J3D65DRAFT_664743 [Phyllosticta citribraziliensis]|uniref:CFEM domain-containing protein n=1 Tax=Phyllosticta citribraziliensis TaxID=989973 RepID=A0ABR1M432_9PEZI
MRFSSVVVLAFASSALAQGLGSEKGGSSSGSDSASPDSDRCFLNCFKTSGCAPGDETCYCNNQAAADKTACCVSKACSPETQKIIGVVSNLVCQKGMTKFPDKQADGCKKSRASRLLFG